MYSISVNGNKTFKTNLSIEGSRFSGELNGERIEGDFLKISPYHYHLIYKHKSFNVDVVKINTEEKSMVLKVNGMRYTLELKDKYDELLHSLGLDKLASKKVNDIKAPMPGMVLKILVEEGATVKKGDALIVLEAMKMENILKSPSEGTIKRIAAVTGTAVEKNQLLIQL
jgi:biotin carboxyl carrier protein